MIFVWIIAFIIGVVVLYKILLHEWFKKERKAFKEYLDYALAVQKECEIKHKNENRVNLAQLNKEIKEIHALFDGEKQAQIDFWVGKLQKQLDDDYQKVREQGSEALEKERKRLLEQEQNEGRG